MNIYNHVWLFFLSLLVLQGVHARDVSFQAHQRGHHDLVALEPVAHNPQTARHLLQLGQGVNEGSIATVVRGEPAWLSTLNTALLSKGKPALLWSSDLVNELYQDTVAKGYDLDRCAAPLNGSFVEGDTVHWQFRDYGVSPLVAGASAMAASYWAAIKATPADVVNENVNVLSTLRSIYSGGFDATATACVVEICKTPGVDVDALITTCILDPGNSQTTSRTEQSSGCKRKVIRVSEYNHSLPAVAQEHNISLANLACWNGLTSLISTPRLVVVPCPEDVTGMPACPAWIQYNNTRDVAGFILRGREYWVEPVNQFTRLKGLNKVTWDSVRAIALGNLLYNNSVAAGRCGTIPRVSNTTWLFASPTPGAVLNTSAVSMLLGMYYTASTARLDDPSTYNGWSFEDVARMRYLFAGAFDDGGPFIGCSMQVCNASFARPYCVADPPPGAWTSARGEALPALEDVAFAPNATCRDATVVKVNANQTTLAAMARQYNRDLQQLLCWYPYLHTNQLPHQYVGLPCSSWVYKPTCDPLRLHLGDDVFKYTVQPYQNTSSVISTLQLDNVSLAACKLCCYNRIQPDNQRFPCEFAPLTTITVSRQALQRPMDGSGCPCIAAEPPEASRQALKQQASAAAPSASQSSEGSSSNVGLIVGVAVGALAVVLCAAMAAVAAVAIMSRRKGRKAEGGGRGTDASSRPPRSDLGTPTPAALDALDIADHQPSSDTSSGKAAGSKNNSPRASSPLGRRTTSSVATTTDGGPPHRTGALPTHTHVGEGGPGDPGLGLLSSPRGGDAGGVSVFEQQHWSGGSWRSSNVSRSGSGRVGGGGLPGSVQGASGGRGPVLQRSPSM